MSSVLPNSYDPLINNILTKVSPLIIVLFIHSIVYGLENSKRLSGRPSVRTPGEPGERNWDSVKAAAVSPHKHDPFSPAVRELLC